MATRGRKHTIREQRLLMQVKRVFTRLKDAYGAEEVIRKLQISAASFYNYVAGTDLPRLEVLRDVTKEWDVKWKHIDPSALLQDEPIKRPEQLIFSFLKALTEESIVVAGVQSEKGNVLRLELKIRFAPIEPTRQIAKESGATRGRPSGD